MNIVEEHLDAYVTAHSENEPEVLMELNRKTHVQVLQPHMISGHFQGRLLSMLSHMIRPKRILEIGTFTGYSAICLAEGLDEGGKLYTIDVNEEMEELVQTYIEKAGMADKIEFIVGDAMQVIRELDEAWDIVFIDADKKNYLEYYKQVFDKVKPGGYIIADNILWKGKVLEQGGKTDPKTQVLMDYNKMVHEDPRVQEVLLPIRDGLMIARKK